MKEVLFFNAVHGEPINHCVVLADEHGETKLVDELGLSIEDGSVTVTGFRDEPHSPASDHISNVRILFFDSLDELEKFKKDFYKSKSFNVS